MCRFVFYKGPPITIASLLTEPSRSLIKQSIASTESEEPLNGDGFGVAWYAPQLSHEPAAFRAVTPAWNNMNLLDLARVTRTPTMLAHVRAATRGQPVTELNCHPFTAGRYAFMHNGDIGGFQHIRRELLATLSDRAFASIKGSTDSETLFAIFLDQVWKLPEIQTGLMIADALRAAVRSLEGLQREKCVKEFNYLNISLTNGEQSVALRYTNDEAKNASSLHVHTGRRYVCRGGICRMIGPAEGEGAVIISSEVLSDDPGWQMVPVNHLVTVSKLRTVEVLPADIVPAESDMKGQRVNSN